MAEGKVVVEEIDRTYGVMGNEVRTTVEYPNASFHIKESSLIVTQKGPYRVIAYPKGTWLQARYEQ